MILSYAIGLMGLQLVPSFSMLGFAARSPKGFRPSRPGQPAGSWEPCCCCFPVAQGLGAHFLGTNPAVDAAGLEVAPLLAQGQDAGVVSGLTAS